MGMECHVLPTIHSIILAYSAAYVLPHAKHRLTHLRSSLQPSHPTTSPSPYGQSSPQHLVPPPISTTQCQ